MNPKEKGNAEERKQAKQLSIWMFNDPDVLKRHPTSGSDKTIYVGDVFPMKQIDQFGWKKFGFMIEIKSGYKEKIPTFWGYEIINKWYKKAKKESLGTNQEIIFLICQFKHQTPLLMTNQFLDQVPFHLSLIIELDDSYEYVFVYNLKNLLKMNFEQLFKDINYKN
jgi:hypothetical protein